MSNEFDPNILWTLVNQTGTSPEWAPVPPKLSSGSYHVSTNRLTAPLPITPSKTNTLAYEMSHAVSENVLRPMATDLGYRPWYTKELTNPEKHIS